MNKSDREYGKKGRNVPVKRIVSLCLALCLCLALVPAASAAVSERQTEQAVALAALDIMSGDANGNLNLDALVTRAQFAKMAVMASPSGRTVSGEAQVSPYYDVPSTHWAAGYVAAARDLGLVRGYLDGLFHPNATIRLEEGVTVVLRLLGYSDSDVVGAYPAGQLTLYSSLGLDEGVTARRGETLTRGDVQNLFYNLLTAKTKEGQVYLTTLGYSLTASGKVDTVALINDAMSEPVVAESGWQNDLPFTSQNATYYRNGKQVAATAITAGDVIYWSESLRTVWAYNNPVSGTITALSPSAANPTSVTVGGVEYTIGTSAAALALSDLGGTSLGDNVTLLLGRDNTVVAVTDVLAGGDTVLYGVVAATGRGSFTDAMGGTYTSDTITLKATNGGTYTYPVASLGGRKAGDLVKVTVTGDKITVTGTGGGSITGKVSSDGSQVGTTPFADDVQILDVYGSDGVVVYPERLAGMNLSSSNVSFCGKNAHGEIDRLILKDATGDMHQYGIITSVEDLSSGMSVNVIYHYILNGQQMVLNSAGVKYPVSSGDRVQIKTQDGQIAGMYALQSTKLDSITGNEAHSGSSSYLVADNAAVYIHRNGSYYLSSLTAVRDAGYQLTGYYDKAVSAGGRIRIIIAS